MKKLILSMLLITATFAVVAQKNPLKRAEKELSAGQLDLAKASIEEAMTDTDNPITKTQAMLGMFDAIENLHKITKYVHKDIKPDNFRFQDG